MWVVASADESRPSAAPTSRNLALAGMLFAVSMTFIDQTIVSIAAPSIIGELGLSSSGMQWVVNSYLLSLAAFFALGGRLADILGHRRMALVGTVVFVVSSALCGAVPSGGAAQTWLVVFRAVQGLGAALMFPAALAVVVEVFPVDRRGRALALFFGVSGALTALGPILGGWLTSWTWRAIFWVNVPVAVIAVVLTLMARIRNTPRPEPVDWPGAFLTAVGMGLSVLGLQQASSWGWGSALTWLCIAGGLAVLALLVVVELRSRDPLITMQIFADRAFSVDNAVLFFAMMAFVPVFFFASVYAQVALDYSPDEAGIYLLLFFAGFGPASQVGGRMLDRRGARTPMLVGTALGAVGFALWAGKITDLSLNAQWPYIVLSGAGIGFLLTPASTDAVNRAIGRSYGEVTGITQTVRNYSASVSLAVLGTVLLHTTADRVQQTLEQHGLPAAQARTTAERIAQGITGHGGGSGTPGGVDSTLLGQIRADFAEANQRVFYGMAAALAVAFVCALRHPGTRVTEATEPAEAQEATAATAATEPAGPVEPPPAAAP
ncbi:MFS transporter [Kitasatospora sp. NPDC088346]|uniref:MFS transporter n=1 Tax=Kitasatospora sp. NPDC088346 TaxID=3364073 RepID=UPI003803CA68